MYRASDPRHNDSFAEHSSGFLAWFQQQDGTRTSDKIEPADLRGKGAGRGLVATHDIETDEELFALPLSLVLTPSTSSLDDACKQEISESGTNWSRLIVTLIYECMQGQASRWTHYLRTLPRSFDTPMFWNEAELAQLQASAVVDKIGKTEAEETWKDTIIPLMQRYPNAFPLGTEEEDENTARWIAWAHMAGSLIMAYAFDIDQDRTKPRDDEGDTEEDGFEEDDEDEPLKGMVPFADMLNADADRNNARLFQEDEELIMKATKPIEAGAEIFNDYGPLPRSDLLRMYGYTTDNYAKYDVAELSHELLVEIAGKSNTETNRAWHKRQEQLLELGIIDDGYAIQRPAKDQNLEAAIPGEVHMVLRGLCMDESTPRLSKLNENESISIEEAALLSAACIKRISEYATTLDEDHKILQALSQHDPIPIPGEVMRSRFTMAVQVRAGEKEILQRLIELCQDHTILKTQESANASRKRGLANGTTSTTHQSKKTKKSR